MDHDSTSLNVYRKRRFYELRGIEIGDAGQAGIHKPNVPGLAGGTLDRKEGIPAPNAGLSLCKKLLHDSSFFGILLRKSKK